MEMFSPEIFINFKGIPVPGDSRRDPDSFQIRPESEDSLYAADHHGGGGSRQPVYVGAAEMAAGRAFGKLTVTVWLESADLCLSFCAAGAFSVKYPNARFPWPLRASARISQPCDWRKCRSFLLSPDCRSRQAHRQMRAHGKVDPSGRRRMPY